MSKRRVFLTVAAVVLAAIVITPLTIDINSCRAPIEQWIVRTAARSGVRLAFTNLHLSWSRLSADRVEIFAPLMRRFFILLEAQRIDLTPSWWSVATLSPSVIAHALVYQGRLDSDISFDALSRKGTANARLQTLRLADHPQLAGLGIVSGNLSAEVLDALWEPGRLVSARGTITIADADKPRDTLLSLEPFGLPFQTTIPAIRKLNATIVFSAQGQSITFSKVEISSSLGTISAPGSIRRSAQGEPDKLNFEARVSLSGQGKQAIGPYLPMISGGRINETADTLQIRISGNAQRPEIKVY